MYVVVYIDAYPPTTAIHSSLYKVIQGGILSKRVLYRLICGIPQCNKLSGFCYRGCQYRHTCSFYYKKIHLQYFYMWFKVHEFRKYRSARVETRSAAPPGVCEIHTKYISSCFFSTKFLPNQLEVVVE